ncbi:MAG TPA: threonine--tRNA ligase [Candidatus Saccharimonadales bacterium]|nr:threonine--tRNA ligase [Candidatus Saccharimonadales bacterium]
MPKTDKDHEALRHSLAHIMATAIKHLWPEAKFGVGPVIEDGFYYDIDLGKTTLSEDDLPKIEAKMAEVIKQDQQFERSEMLIDEAIAWAKSENQPYKLELLNDLKRQGTTLAREIDATDLGVAASAQSKVDKVSFYKNGDFTDLCRGPHLKSTKEAGAFKLTKVSGAYWRGNEKNPQMQRVYGVAFPTSEELEEYLKNFAEAKERDHRKLGQELDLFVFSDLVGAGLPLYTPRGTVLIDALKQALKDIGDKYDMLPVSIPHLGKLELYKISGHAEKFEDELFKVKSHYNQEFVLKPVNCPHHIQIYASQARSYRDLPLRYVEQTMQYRDEKPGQIGGLQRTRGFTVDDGHTFCRVDQIKEEAATIVNMIKEFYEQLGLWGDHWVSLSVRDKSDFSKYIGNESDWDKAEKMLAEVSDEHQLKAKRMEGEAALYGPKLDFMFKDALGRETQLATIQLDFAMPERFGISYVNSEGSNETPVIIHRAILGSFERFIMLIIEHFGGRFPLWLAPEQLRLISLNQEPEVLKTVSDMAKMAKGQSIRVAIDDTNESVGKKIRKAELLKVPYSIVVGDQEIKEGKVKPRARSDLSGTVSESLGFEDFLKELKKTL